MKVQKRRRNYQLNRLTIIKHKLLESVINNCNESETICNENDIFMCLLQLFHAFWGIKADNQLKTQFTEPTWTLAKTQKQVDEKWKQTLITWLCFALATLKERYLNEGKRCSAL